MRAPSSIGQITARTMSAWYTMMGQIRIAVLIQVGGTSTD